MKKIWIGLMVGCVMVFLVGRGWAVVPPSINIQGKLSDNGLPVEATTPVNLNFQIYSDGGGDLADVLLWSGTSSIPSITGGIFNTQINLNTGNYMSGYDINTVFSGQRLLLGITYNGTEIIRQPLASVPYAITAQHLADGPQSINGPLAIQDNTVMTGVVVLPNHGSMYDTDAKRKAISDYSKRLISYDELLDILNITKPPKGTRGMIENPPAWFGAWQTGVDAGIQQISKIDAKVNSIVLPADLSGQFANLSSQFINLSDNVTNQYATTNALNTAITGLNLGQYVTTTGLNTEITGLNLGQYVTTTGLNTAITGLNLGQYATTTGLNTAITGLNLGQYATTNALTASLSNYVAKGSVGAFADIMRSGTTLPTTRLNGTGLQTGDTFFLTGVGMHAYTAGRSWHLQADDYDIKNLDASYIKTGVLTGGLIPALDASKITTGNFAATRISGQLLDSQIAGVGAAKISGAIADSQIAAISASKLSGAIQDSQIAGISGSKVGAGIAASKVYMGGSTLGLDNFIVYDPAPTITVVRKTGNIVMPLPPSITNKYRTIIQGPLSINGSYLYVNPAISGAWGGWNECIRMDNDSHAAITAPDLGMLFGMHGDGHYYWADTTSNLTPGGKYCMYLSKDGDLQISGATEAVSPYRRNYIDLKANDYNTAIELRSDWSGGTPYIDFSSSSSVDYDSRIISVGPAQLNIPGKLSLGATQNSGYRLYSSSSIWINGSVYYTGSLSFQSDERLKKNIEPISDALQKVNNIRGVKYDWRTEEYPEKDLPKGKQLGVVAQEVEKEFPELVTLDEKGFRTVAMDKLTPVLLEAVKELKSENDSLKAQNAAFESRLKALEEKIGK